MAETGTAKPDKTATANAHESTTQRVQSCVSKTTQSKQLTHTTHKGVRVRASKTATAQNKEQTQTNDGSTRQTAATGVGQNKQTVSPNAFCEMKLP